MTRFYIFLELGITLNQCLKAKFKSLIKTLKTQEYNTSSVFQRYSLIKIQISILVKF